ncbi:hypothetical protein D4R99_04545 [bacterium]|nr:MAG: hypothetical protein D4R99_04545 [bacterium]
MKKLILIKFGGSLISDKSKIDTARLDVISNLSKQIKEILDQKKDLSLIIATGAGGFGHPLAEKYKNNLEKGLPKIKKAVKKINQIVVNSLNKEGIKSESVEPSGISEYKNEKMVSLFHGSIVSLLEKNIIPVFHADLTKDQQLGISILSMDKFLVDLAIFFKNKGYKIEKVIFAGTTAGVVSRVGTTIQRITKNSFLKIKEVFYQGKGIDVSGGMMGKVRECLRLIDEKIPCIIIDGQKENNFKNAILDKEVFGTQI